MSNLESEGITIVRADYYGYLKCYCLNFTQGIDLTFNETSRLDNIEIISERTASKD